MSRFHSHINTAEKIISRYDGSTPFHLFLKEFFAADKRYGSRDRKSIAANCYAFFRVAHAFPHTAVQEIIRKGLFLSTQLPVDGLDDSWNEKISLPAEEKLSALHIKATDLFPFYGSLSPLIDQESFCLSHLFQPDFFIRVRPGMKERVEEKLSAAGCFYECEGENGIRLHPGFSIKDILVPDAEVVIQDISSQEVLDPFLSMMPSKQEALSVWDCCAGSGGKSILLHDKMRRPLDLTVSDSRKNILFNLQGRLKTAGVAVRRSVVADLTQASSLKGSFDLILCDVPCTGSGTWARTPDQLHYFSETAIEPFVFRQEQILQHVIPQLSPGGLLIYITCSVFAAENEKLVEGVAQRHAFKIQGQKYLKGYHRKADTLFAAALSRK
jgi:16S rRNA (cytosine967-C5)-methyltransferase